MAKPTQCGRCGRENDPSFAFCLDCGLALRPPTPAPPAPSAAAVCASCGEPLRAGFRFCGRCGAPAGATPARPAIGPSGTGVHAALPPRTPAPPPEPPPLPHPRSGGVRLAAVRTDGLPGATHALEPGEAVCGRTEGAIRIADDPTVSPRHARFTLRHGALSVEDLGSASGTFVRIRDPRRLAPGAEVRVGRQLLRLEPAARPRHPEPDAVRAWGSADAGHRFRLVQLLEGGGTGEVFPLREGANQIGRESGEVTFPADRYVSARHARVEVTAEAITLADLGSSNGTFVRISGPVELSPGDQLLVGAQLFRIEA
ncbi:MAG TPA: FHA domain-containing protein [Anaeromyxobacter sp.]|nr:FHA domain-containing protein [Anaeromyxobacter sp.]